MTENNKRILIAAGGGIVIGTVVGYGVAAHQAEKKRSAILTEQHSKSESIEVVVLSTAPVTVSRIKNVPDDVVKKMKQMRDDGATLQLILDTLGREHGLKFQSEVRRVIGKDKYNIIS